MRAVQFATTGGPDVLEVVEVPRPEPGPDEVLIRVVAIGVNFSEVGRRRGSFPLPPGVSLPYVPGYECSGTVELVGANVSNAAVGDRVLARGYASTYAEFAAVPAASVYVLPDALAFIEASGVAGMYSTAWQNVVNRGNVQQGETVLIQACASGVGIANVQVAKHRGATVIGTASTDEKLTWAKGLGVDHTINYSTQDFVEEVRKLTDGKGVPVVVDGVGGETFLRGLKCLSPGGRMVVYGVAAGERTAIVTLPELWFTNLTVMGSGSSGVSRDDFQRVIDLVAGGSLKVPVDRTWPLEQAAEAHRYLESRQVRGKIVLTVD
jgi:NADPH2:quinone reductase